jgi:hypothetical protein
VWFQLHPIGFLVRILIDVARYGSPSFWDAGQSPHHALRRHQFLSENVPLFLGLGSGDVAMMLFWLLIDGWQGRVGHKLMPG